MNAALGAVDHAQRALCAGQLNQLGQRLPAAQYVGQLADREQATARADQRGGLLQVDLACVRSSGRIPPGFSLRRCAQLLPGQQVGVVFQRADDDFVAGAAAAVPGRRPAG